MKPFILVRSVLMVLIFLFQISCRKDIAKGQLIHAEGFVIDSVKNKRLPNATIYLYGAHASFYGIYYDYLPLDSTVSDINGNFSMKYTAQGNAIDYVLNINYPFYRGYRFPNNYVIDVSHPFYPFNYSNHLKNVAIRARELNYARLILSVRSNPYDTLYLDLNSASFEFYLRYQFIGNSIDTFILTRCLALTSNYFQYSITAVSLSDSGSGKHRVLVDTVNADLSDTIVIKKTINSTYDLPFEPY